MLKACLMRHTKQSRNCRADVGRLLALSAGFSNASTCCKTLGLCNMASGGISTAVMVCSSCRTAKPWPDLRRSWECWHGCMQCSDWFTEGIATASFSRVVPARLGLELLHHHCTAAGRSSQRCADHQQRLHQQNWSLSDKRQQHKQHSLIICPVAAN